MLAGDLAVGRPRRTHRWRRRVVAIHACSRFSRSNPMLADSASDVGEALAALGEASFEYKLDGARIQVHKANDDVKVLAQPARRDDCGARKSSTSRARCRRARSSSTAKRSRSVPTGAPQPFQVTMRRFGRRARRRSVAERAADHAVLLRRALSRRRPAGRRAARARRVAVAGGAGGRPRTSCRESSRLRADEAATFAARAIATGHEGVMAKSLARRLRRAGAAVRPGSKVKQARTLDLVILAAEWGTAAAAARSATCISAPATPSAAASSCSARRSRA